MQSILRECFESMKLAKVDLFVFEYNTVAINLYRKIGFETEEIIANRIQLNGKFVPLYLMGLTYDQWITFK